MPSERASTPGSGRSIKRYFNSDAVQATMCLVIGTVSTKWVFFVYVATPTPARAASAGAFLCVGYIGWRKRKTIDRWWKRVRATRQPCVVCSATRPLYWARKGWFLAAACSLLAIFLNSCLEKRLEQARRPIVVQCAMPPPFYCQAQSEALCDLDTPTICGNEQMPVEQAKQEVPAVRTGEEAMKTIVEEEEQQQKEEQEERQEEEEEFGGQENGWIGIHTKTPIEKKKSKSFREAFLEELGDPLDWAWY